MYTIEQIAKIVKGKFKGNKDQKIDNLLFDSRMHISSQNSLFFAIKTARDDGHNYITNLIEKQVKNFVVHKNFHPTKQHKNCNFIFVDNTVEALQELAAYHRNNFKIPIIAITGSNGKTIVKEWLSAVLNKISPTLQSPKSYNSQIGVPMSIWQLNNSYKYAIFEAGISQPNEMSKLEKIIQPTIGIFTNIGDAHQENFDTLDQKISEKLKLFKNCKTIIYSPDYKEVSEKIKEIYPQKNSFTWSLKQQADLQVINKKNTNNHTILTIKYKSKNYDIQLKFKDLASIYNFLTAMSAFLVLIPDKTPKYFDLSLIEPVEMRLQQIEAINNCTLINDSYSCDLTSLGMAIDVLNSQNQHPKKTVILSDIFQVGLDNDNLYKKVAEILHKNNVKRLIGVGEKLHQYQNYFHIEKQFYKSTDELVQNIEKIHFFNEAILVKGARNFHFEDIIRKLQLKNHPTILEINMSALEHNLQYFKGLLKPSTKIMIMVKAFSYGSGSYEIANFLEKKNVDYLAVAIADEAVELRKAGIQTPILVLNPDSSNFDIFAKYKLEPEIYSFRMLEEFYKHISKSTVDNYPIHLKFNTGMNRVGFEKNQLPKLVKKLKSMPKLVVKSAFSHLVGADDRKFDEFTLQQISKFKSITEQLESLLGYSFLKHILNSAGIERFPQYQMDMVRVGIGLYGISSNNKLLKNISTLKTRIIQIREIEAGESVGYSRAWIAKRKSKIATLPIGYADGLNRKLSNGVGKVWLNGKFVPIVGNICMDITMIDVTDVESREGDTVIIFGDVLPVSQLANLLETIPYEILTSISQRVKRVYLWQ